MAKPSTRRARPASASNDGRLDPVRWHRPGRGTLLRLSAATALLVTAAVASWSPAQQSGAATDPPKVAAPPSTGKSAALTHPTGKDTGSPTGASVAQPGAGADSPTGMPPAGSAGVPPAGSVGVPPAGSVGVPPPGNVGVPPPGSIGVPIRLADPTGLALVSPGDRVDLLRLGKAESDGNAGTGPTTIATDAQVLKITPPDDLTAGGLLLALTPAQAQQAVSAAPQGFAILVRPR